MRSEFITWRGHRIFVTVTGQGDPLLLVPGLGNNVGMWVPFMQQFPNRRIIRLDAPGTGLSSTPLFPISVPELADLLVAVLDDRGVPWADVVGFSYGGAVAQQLAFDHPTRVRRLVLAATNCGIGAFPGWLPAVMSLATPIRYYSPSFFDRTAAATNGGVTARDQAIRERMINARRSHPPAADGYTMQLLGIVGWSSWHFLRGIPHETLVIAGDDDRWCRWQMRGCSLGGSRMRPSRSFLAPGIFCSGMTRKTLAGGSVRSSILRERGGHRARRVLRGPDAASSVLSVEQHPDAGEEPSLILALAFKEHAAIVALKHPSPAVTDDDVHAAARLHLEAGIGTPSAACVEHANEDLCKRPCPATHRPPVEARSDADVPSVDADIRFRVCDPADFANDPERLAAVPGTIHIEPKRDRLVGNLQQLIAAGRFKPGIRRCRRRIGPWRRRFRLRICGDYG